jgi:hypothetical protein
MLLLSLKSFMPQKEAPSQGGPKRVDPKDLFFKSKQTGKVIITARRVKIFSKQNRRLAE